MTSLRFPPPMQRSVLFAFLLSNALGRQPSAWMFAPPGYSNWGTSGASDLLAPEVAKLIEAITGSSMVHKEVWLKW